MPDRGDQAQLTTWAKVDYESRTLGLDRNELGAFLVQAGLSTARDHALASLLALNGLRISEALGADIHDLDWERGHRTLKILRKGDKHVTIPLAPRTSQVIDLYVGERTAARSSSPPAVGGWTATPPTAPSNAWPAITKCISPHSLRHSFITAAPDAGVPLRDVQEAASHADREPRCPTTGAAAPSTAMPPTLSPPSSPAHPADYAEEPRSERCQTPPALRLRRL